LDTRRLRMVFLAPPACTLTLLRVR
jgi:hypothetical protein